MLEDFYTLTPDTTDPYILTQDTSGGLTQYSSGYSETWSATALHSGKVSVSVSFTATTSGTTSNSIQFSVNISGSGSSTNISISNGSSISKTLGSFDVSAGQKISVTLARPTTETDNYVYLSYITVKINAKAVPGTFI